MKERKKPNSYYSMQFSATAAPLPYYLSDQEIVKRNWPQPICINKIGS